MAVFGKREKTGKKNGENRGQSQAARMKKREDGKNRKKKTGKHCKKWRFAHYADSNPIDLPICWYYNGGGFWRAEAVQKTGKTVTIFSQHMADGEPFMICV